MKNRIITLLLIIPLLISCNNETKDKEKISLIAKSIYSIEKIEYTPNNPNYALEGIVHLGGSLYEELLEMSEEGFVEKSIIKKGDVFYDMNNKADYHLIIISNMRKIAIRLRYDDNYKKYHVIGYVEVI
ncbi:hypothetical protein KMW28_25150 [Flammeovirga yaeyamensis]|uniref:Lipoprotein n=1 Tax=Flammeovirga yaeyamensis TaxID=367791 RepID=A0AAX1N9P7_9BACT|nr:hypothetical protein [Flammeovirga yaeyamensis]MBB3699419.1 putative restriction endonuclease [Flammeovirga yaeyamensis]NMF35322.1 hypothetical protein [Flammeovirga yaeyamensis]QWG04182.1 hypothetical protein KMW28_25150 [Flammeovirga yaeyamensis]